MAKWVTANTQAYTMESKRPVSEFGGLPWADNTIRWCADPEIDTNVLNAFLIALKQYEAALPGCLIFEKISEQNGNCLGYPNVSSVYVKSSNNGCNVNGISGEWPKVMRDAFGRLALNLEPAKCDTVSVAMHEMGHVLGMTHEQSRPDRDQWIRINWENVKPDWKDQFGIEKGFVGKPYDYHSIMQYPMFTPVASINATIPLMTPINCAQRSCPATLGQTKGLSKGD